jgi:hypothetical protein
MTNTILTFPIISGPLSCIWFETVNPNQPLACVWVDRRLRKLERSPREAEHQRASAKRSRREPSIARSILPVLTSFLLTSSLAGAQNGSPVFRPSEQFRSMQLPADKDPHDIENERYLLLPAADKSFTGTAMLDLGIRTWRGAEGCLMPELITERPLSNLRGLGGAMQNFEWQKGGTTTPRVSVPTASETTQPSKPDDTALGFMDQLSKTGQHDVHDET